MELKKERSLWKTNLQICAGGFGGTNPKHNVGTTQTKIEKTSAAAIEHAICPAVCHNETYGSQ